MQVCVSHGTHAYSQTPRVPSSFSTSVLCCGVCILGTSSPLFSASEVHFDPWGLHARHAATLPHGGPIGL